MPTTITPPTGAVAMDRATPDTAQAVSTKPLLVATDGSASADAAFVAARLLAKQSGAPVKVLTVLEQQLLYFPSPYPVIPLEAEREQMHLLGARARGQVKAHAGEGADWAIETRYGQPAHTIHRYARETDAEMILTGLSRHGVLDRVLGEETSPHIAQVTEVPLLTVAAGTTKLPRTVVIAIDPNAPAIPDSQAVRALLSEVEAVHLVNVQPRSTDTIGLAPAPWDESYEEGLTVAAERVKSSLGLPARVFKDLIVALGNPAKEILRAASELRADLLIVAQRRRGVIISRPGGGLAARLLRGTDCSVLVIPQPIGVARYATPSRAVYTETLADRTQWAERLAEISTRNLGRRASLEVDDPRLGAQLQATDYPFLGADYDRADDRVSIILGYSQGGTSHLSHNVAGPVSIDILAGQDGKTRVLRVDDGAGQALLTFLG